MYTVFHNMGTTPIRLALWLDAMLAEGKELVAVSGQLFYFKSTVDPVFHLEHIDVETVRLTPVEVPS